MEVLMGRIKNDSAPSSSSDLKLTLSEIVWNGISKHRSCWRHVAAHLHRHEKKITLREVKDIKNIYSGSSPCFSPSFSCRKRTKKKTNKKIFPHVERNKLDTDTFEQYMESLWKSLPEEKRTQFAYLDSLWFTLYRDAAKRPKVLNWISQKGIFSKKYVLVPIICWSHWSLLIFVHLGESLSSENRKPCMLLLDSLETADPRRLEPEIRKFIVDIYEAEGITEDKKVISRIPLLIPKVPQQRDDAECGRCVLYFIKLFIESAPVNFSICNGYPYFMKRDWFSPKSLEHFSNKLEKGRPTKMPGKEQSKKMPARNSSVHLRKRRKKRSVISLDD